MQDLDSLVVGNLTLINISKNFIDKGGIDVSYNSALVNVIQSMNDWAFMISVSFLFAVGGIIFYYMLYKTRLIPRFLSGWGFLAEILLLVGTILIIFEMFSGVSLVMLEAIFALPIAIQEMAMAVWMILKGFNSNS
jgi:hypothetical protein